MSGVVDARGRQWEHCNCCGRLVNINRLWTEETARQEPLRDLCVWCAKRVARLTGATLDFRFGRVRHAA